jgi:hypothetical protein
MSEPIGTLQWAVRSLQYCEPHHPLLPGSITNDRNFLRSRIEKPHCRLLLENSYSINLETVSGMHSASKWKCALILIPRTLRCKAIRPLAHTCLLS